MKRIQEKVKDIVDVRSYESLQDFISNPAQTLAIYHFTDLTSDLMTKWLDKIAKIQPQSGESCALAGYRGVGKSHFLATLGAIAAHPELRFGKRAASQTPPLCRFICAARTVFDFA